MSNRENLKAYHATLLTDDRFMLLLDALESESAFIARPWSNAKPINEAEHAYDSGCIQGCNLAFNKLRGKL